MVRLRRTLLQIAACGVFALAAGLSLAADLSVDGVAQARPGEVVVRVGYTGAAPPPPSALSLHLGNDAPIKAASVEPVPASAAPVALLLCLDRSGSMGRPAIAAMQAAIHEALGMRGQAATLPFDVAIVAFATRTTPLLTLTNDRERIDREVGELTLETERDGKSRLYDAVAGGLAELRATDVATKRLIVVSDGDDEDSRITQKELIRRAVATGIPIDAIGLGSRASSQSGSLATMAGATNGSFQVAGNGAELTAALSTMIRRALPRQQVEVTFQYKAAADGAASEPPSLVYAIGDAAPIALPLNVSAASASSGTKADSPAERSSLWETLKRSMSLATVEHALGKWSVLARVGMAILALLLVAIVILWFRARTGGPESMVYPQVMPEPAPLPPADVPRSRPPPPTPPAVPARAPAGPRTMVKFDWPTPGEGRVVAVLEVVQGGTGRRRIEIHAPRVTIGSASDNDAILEGDDYLSGHHALVRAEAQGLYIVDLGSTNGSELNGARFKDTTRALSPGDRLMLGRTILEVLTAETAYPLRPAHAQRAR